MWVVCTGGGIVWVVCTKEDVVWVVCNVGSVVWVLGTISLSVDSLDQDQFNTTNWFPRQDYSGYDCFLCPLHRKSVRMNCHFLSILTHLIFLYQLCVTLSIVFPSRNSFLTREGKGGIYSELQYR